MWDIKLLSESISNEPFGTFHLNHVGYKGQCQLLLLSFITFFHLNHVGYKG